MKNKQELYHMCTSMGHMSTNFNKIFGHQLWQQSRKYHGNKTNALHFLKIAYRKSKCPSPCEKLGKLTFMIGLQIKVKLKPSMSM